MMHSRQQWMQCPREFQGPIHQTLSVHSFLLRDEDMHSAYLLSKDGQMAGWVAGTMSVTRMCLIAVKPILNFFDHLVAPSFRFSLTQAPMPITRETPAAGSQNTRGGKICDFRLKSPFISEMVQDIGRWLQWNVNRKSWVPDRTVSFSMTLSDLKLGFQGHGIFTSRISRKRCVLGTKLLKNANRKLYPVYRIVELSMTLSDL